MAVLRVARTSWPADGFNTSWVAQVPPGHQAAGAQPAVSFLARQVPVEVQNPNALREQRVVRG